MNYNPVYYSVSSETGNDRQIRCRTMGMSQFLLQYCRGGERVLPYYLGDDGAVRTLFIIGFWVIVLILCLTKDV